MAHRSFSAWDAKGKTSKHAPVNIEKQNSKTISDHLWHLKPRTVVVNIILALPNGVRSTLAALNVTSSIGETILPGSSKWKRADLESYMFDVFPPLEMSYIIISPPWKRCLFFWGVEESFSMLFLGFIVHFTRRVVVKSDSVQRMFVSRTIWKNPGRKHHYLSYPKEKKCGRILVLHFWSPLSLTSQKWQNTQYSTSLFAP